MDETEKVVRRAFELGINHFDTAKLDRDSEEKNGAALKDIRDERILVTKTASRTKRESLADFRSSLRRLHACKKLPEGLEVGVCDCTKCDECEPRCMYKLPIRYTL